MDNNETIQNIVSEMRGHTSGRAEDAWYTPEDWRELCNRIEAASAKTGHAAALRAMLKKFTDHVWLQFGGPNGAHGSGQHGIAELLEESRALLAAAAPRRCDVLTPTEAHDEWDKYRHRVTPPQIWWLTADVIDWLYEKAEKGGAK